MCVFVGVFHTTREMEHWYNMDNKKLSLYIVRCVCVCVCVCIGKGSECVSVFSAMAIV